VRPFRFSLEPVEVLRTRAEVLAREAYGRAVRRRIGAERMVQHLEQRLEEIHDSISRRREVGFQAHQVIQGFRDLENHTLVLKAAREQAAELRREELKVRESLVKAKIDLDVVHKLRERKFQVWQRELDLEQEKVTQEFVNARLVRESRHAS